ncbi:MAG: hypothetical protein HY598_04240, partial [Candidatus Omnitrophica bacterium]|nr:hypothetical protein [Candidatus Omnitrophota bacterium]
MTERRVLLASILSILCVSLYSQALMRTTKQRAAQQIAQIPAASPTLLMPAKIDAVLPTLEEPTVTVESGTLRLEIGATTGSVRSAVLKEFRNAEQTAPLQFDAPIPILSLQSADGKINIESVRVTGTRTLINGS